VAKDKLTPKQEMFVKEYLVDLNATQAYLRAGYKCNEEVARRNASRLLTKADVARAIEEANQKRAEKLELTAEWVLENLKNVAVRCQQAEPVMVFDYSTKEMVETGEYQFDSKGANRALELIGKHLGIFEDKLRLSGSMGVKIVDDVDDG
jgi:phage terminase small subunit